MKNIKIVKKQKVFLIIFLVLIIFLNNILVISSLATENKVNLEFFYTTGCETCDSKKIVVNQIEEEYNDQISIKWVLIHDDPSTFNYSYWKSYGFDYVPGLIIKNNSNTGFVALRHDEITIDKIKDIINTFNKGEKPKNYAIRPFVQTYDEISININENFLLNASESYDTDGEIKYYTWDFGDDQYKYGKTIEYNYTKVGTYTVKLTVEDDQGYQNFTEIKINVIDENNKNTPYPSVLILILILMIITYLYRKKRYF